MPHDEEAIISPATAVNANGCDFAPVALAACGNGEVVLETELGIVDVMKTEGRRISIMRRYSIFK